MRLLKIFISIISLALFSHCATAQEPINLPSPDWNMTVMEMMEVLGEPIDFELVDPVYAMFEYSTNIAEYETSIRYFYNYEEDVDLYILDTVDYAFKISDEQTWKECVNDFEAMAAGNTEKYFDAEATLKTDNHLSSNWDVLDIATGKKISAILDIKINELDEIYFWYTLSKVQD